MLVNADVTGLEVVVAAELSGDKVLGQEIITDAKAIHTNNQKAFNLPDRRDAKFFKFRLLYGTSAYGFSKDQTFAHIGGDEEFWQGIMDAYYAKYSGISQWHKGLIREAQENRKLVIPSGRHYPISPDYSKREPWPLTIIKNYPVQGFGADLVMLARLEAARLIRESGLECLLISTVHDSIVADTPERNVSDVGKILFDSIESVPRLCKQVFGYDFKLPLTSEVQFGRNKKSMEELTFT